MGMRKGGKGGEMNEGKLILNRERSQKEEKKATTNLQSRLRCD